MARFQEPLLIKETIQADVTPIFGSWFSALERDIKLCEKRASGWQSSIIGMKGIHREVTGDLAVGVIGRRYFAQSRIDSTQTYSLRGQGFTGFDGSVGNAVKLHAKSPTITALAMTAKWGPAVALDCHARANDPTWPDTLLVAFCKFSVMSAFVGYHIGFCEANGTSMEIIYRTGGHHQAYFEITDGVATPKVRDATGTTDGATITGLTANTSYELAIVINNSAVPRSIDFYVDGSLKHSFLSPSTEKWPTAIIHPLFEIYSSATNNIAGELMATMAMIPLNNKEL